MRTESGISSNDWNKCSEHLAGRETTVTFVTAIVGTVVALTFLFGFGNVLALGLRLGVPIWVAPMVAPAVDLSVVALLLGTRHLALHGGPVDVLKSARRLLIFASMVTLALNVAEPLIEGDYGKAAFDAVGPLLLIGFSSAVCVSHLIRRVVSRVAIPAFQTCTEEGDAIRGRRPSGRGSCPERRSTRRPAAGNETTRHCHKAERIGWAEVGPGLLQAMQTTAVSASPPVVQAAGDLSESILADHPAVPPLARQRRGVGTPSAEVAPHGNGSGARHQDLLHRARAEDVLHWQQHQRPISAETLRKRLHVGAGAARGLVAQLRSDTHIKLDSQAPKVAAS